MHPHPYLICTRLLPVSSPMTKSVFLDGEH
jgi:hypothetical protein